MQSRFLVHWYHRRMGVARVLGLALLAIGGAFMVRTCTHTRPTPSAQSLSAGLSAVESEPNQTPLSHPLIEPRIVVFKAERRLELSSNGQVVRRYRIALGGQPVGDKEREGDRRTPEGTFTIRLKNPRSQYTLSLGLDYPHTEDAQRGLRDGRIDRATHDTIVAAHKAGRMPPQKTALGGEIFIHGKGSASDWTWGCIALDDDAIRELYEAIPTGTRATIKP